MTTEIDLWQPEKSNSPEIPAEWDFQAADMQFDSNICAWRRLTEDVVAHLWIFYNKLKMQGRRSDLSTNVEKLPSWLEWIESKGISSVTTLRHFRLLGWLPRRELLISDEPAEIKPGEYRTVIIDPPWPYETQYDSKTRRVGSPYPEMTIEAITETQYPFADDCVLWLWSTHKFLPVCFEMLQRWGFDYKAILTWNKMKMGIGFWLRMQCEFCLLAIKGNPKWESTKTIDIIQEKGREHSRKPEAFYDIVLDICPKPIGEAFARQKREPIQFICGNQSDKFSI